MTPISSYGIDLAHLVLIWFRSVASGFADHHKRPFTPFGVAPERGRRRKKKSICRIKVQSYHRNYTARLNLITFTETQARDMKPGISEGRYQRQGEE